MPKDPRAKTLQYIDSKNIVQQLGQELMGIMDEGRDFVLLSTTGTKVRCIADVRRMESLHRFITALEGYGDMLSEINSRTMEEFDG